MRAGRLDRRRPGRGWIAAALGGLLLLATGCGDFFNKDTGGGGGGGSTTGSYTYVGTQAGMLVSYAVSSSGGLTTLSGSPYQLSTAAINSLAVTPNNAFLYAAVAGAGVYGLSLNGGTGVPTLVSTSALVSDVTPIAVAVSPGGGYLLAAGLSNGSPAVGEYAINGDGTLTAVSGSPVTVTLPSGANASNVTVNSIAIAPNSSYVFVSMGQLGVAALPFSSSGALATNTVVINPRTTSGVSNQDMGLAVNPGSTVLFVGETNAGVRVLTIGSNTFTEISGSPFPAGSQPRALQLAGAGDYLYVANGASNTISGYSVLSSGALTALTSSPYSSVGTAPYALAVDQSGKYLIAVNQGTSPNVQVYSFAGSGGVLSAGATATNATTASAVASTH